MTVTKLIEMLNRCDQPNATVMIWDPDTEQYEPVSGCIFGGTEKEILLESDDVS